MKQYNKRRQRRAWMWIAQFIMLGLLVFCIARANSRRIHRLLISNKRTRIERQQNKDNGARYEGMTFPIGFFSYK